MNVVVVESPAKAKTINKYLGSDYRVVASYGHIRDLPAKDGSVRPDEAFDMDWEIDPRSEKHVKAIIQELKSADRLYLATDPDREGEAISWHVQEELRKRRALKDVAVSRVTFNEITKSAVLDAIANPRDLDQALIDAYLARRALDYLVGFTLSPVLWRKLPGARSAGRVQSVALRLICEREAEIEVFRPREYWSVDVVLKTPAGDDLPCALAVLDGEKLDKFALGDGDSANRAAERIRAAGTFGVAAVDRKRVKRNPYPPFTTSTLQQEASRKLGFSATQTMRVAQRLYEGVALGSETVGLITYMRTDSVTLSNEAIGAIRNAIANIYGDEYLPSSPRMYKTKAKNAQEAHEAIRPTDMARTPKEVARYLDDDQRRLYELIWRRTMACEMVSAELDRVVVDLTDASGAIGLRATGSVVAFDGFMKAYREDRDDPDPDEAGEEGRRLPTVKEGDRTDVDTVAPNQHFTQPPPRYSEASLVKKLEELGIGRPSTYASIIQVLQDREYVTLDRRRFVPGDRGRLVTAFLEGFFRRYVEYNFTADLENQLDDISGGRIDWRTVLREFWQAFQAAIAETRDLTIGQVLENLDASLGQHFFPSKADGSDPRACPSCATGRLGLRLGKHGAFIGCGNYPECRYTRPLALPGDDEAGNAAAGDGPIALGNHPETGMPVSVRKGPYGFYIQHGEPAEGEKTKPQRVALPKDRAPDGVDLDFAVQLLALPRIVGRHSETGEPIYAGLGRFGPYLKYDSTYVSLPSIDEVLTIGENRANALLAEKKGGRGGGAAVLASLGDHPGGGAVTVNKGRYGPYVKWGRVFASVPKNQDPATVTLEQAVALLAAKAGAKANGKTASKKPAAKKATGKKPATKKAAAKPAARKPSARKSGKPSASAEPPG
ncbi:MAG: type I DNA topoisomerase [Alphaproteobacteria bacterium]